MELAVSVTIRQRLLYFHCTSEFEAPGNAGVSSGKSLFVVPHYKLCTNLWLVGHQVFFRFQVTVAAGLGVRIRATTRQIGKQVPLVVLRAESTLFLLHGVYRKTNRQM